MEKSIENTWKEGFLNSNALVAPKLNNLYNQKSQHLVDRLKRMLKMNLIGILVGAVLVFIASIFVNMVLLGSFLSLLLIGLVVYGKQQMNKKEILEKGSSSYEYLKSFDQWLKGVIAGYTLIFRFVYPAIFLVMMMALWTSGIGLELRNDLMGYESAVYMVQGIPVFWALWTFVVAGLLALFAGPIYKLDLELVYGSTFQKLEDLLAEMEELQK